MVVGGRGGGCFLVLDTLPLNIESRLWRWREREREELGESGERRGEMREKEKGR